MSHLTHEAVSAITGRLSDGQMSAVLALAPSEADLMAAVAWIGADDATGRERHGAPAGKAATLIEILTAEEPSAEEVRERA